MTVFTNETLLNKGNLNTEIYKMQVMTIGMSKLVVGEADSPIRCDVVIHQEDGHFDDFCFIYHMAHDLKSTVKYNEEIERIKRIMDSSAQFNVYINPVEFIENCTRCLENAPTNRYTKTVYSGTSIESMRYFVQLVADSDENLISEAHAMVARFMESLKGTVFLQSVASQLEFKIPDATTYQRELLVGDRFRDFMAALKGYIFKDSQDKAKEKVNELVPVHAETKLFPFGISVKEEAEAKEDICKAIHVNSDNEIAIAYLYNGRIGTSKSMKLADFIKYIVDKAHHGKYIASRDTMIAVAKQFFGNQDFQPEENQIKDYYKFIDWVRNVSVIGKRYKVITSLVNLVDVYNKAENTAIIITKRGEALKSNYNGDFKYKEYAIESDSDMSKIIDVANKERAFTVFIDSNLGKYVKPLLESIMKCMNKYESNNIGWKKPKLFIETATNFWINMFSYYYLDKDFE
ncbi:hypothetical protein JDFnp4_89 [Fusobacterium phage JD-Fnp4]|nr:hypothetical protein JDFnp4_89 [Fusobacterium phage JD-Fnp4]